jgi:hypothetical protein
MNIDVDIDIDDIISSMGRRERKELLESLQDDGYIPESCKISNEGEVLLPDGRFGAGNDDFDQALAKLAGNGWKLTKEQEDYIIELAKRF